VDLREIGYEGVDWICVPQEGLQFLAIVNRKMDLLKKDSAP
jgi:hypothetical protein